ncbi:MAG: hypothetical protein RBT65_19235 [Methanolobus sp.]|nr:hypothetical protein [Methanolobus sp.]
MKPSKEWLKDIKISQELKDKIYYDEENDLWVISWNAVGQSLTELEELKDKAYTLLLGLNAEPSDRNSQEYQKWQGDIVDAMNGLNKLVGDKDE